MNLLVVGCSHRTAPVAVRERLTVPEPRIAAILADLLTRFGGEALVLSTCNRVEVYVSPEAADRRRCGRRLSRRMARSARGNDPRSYL